MTKTTAQEKLDAYHQFLILSEYSENTIRHYCRDVGELLAYLAERDEDVSKENMIAYKRRLEVNLKPTSINRKIAAFNSFLRFEGIPQYCLKSLKVQKETTMENELSQREFERLVNTAKATGRTRLAMIMMTLAGTGIRIGELRYINVQSVTSGKVLVYNKGKVRTVILPGELQQLLIVYCRQHGIRSGMLFANKRGDPLSRSYVAAEMKRIALRCRVNPEKVYPHNLRHFFARLFIECGYPVTDLADHLGHNNINTTRRYLITSTATKQRQLSKLTIFRHRFPQTGSVAY